MHRAIRIAAMLLVALLGISAAGVQPAGAHSRVSQAGYEFVFGAMDEPMITGQRTWLEVRVNDAATKDPVQGLEADGNLTVTLQHEAHEKTISMGRVSGTPGSYKAAVWFTQAGEFPAIVRGKNAAGEPFELKFTAKVSAASDLYGPAPTAAGEAGHKEEAVSALENADITLQIGAREILVNGNARGIDVAPRLIDGRTMVPLRFISEAMGVPVHWDGETQRVHLGVMTGMMQPGSGMATEHGDSAPHGPSTAMPGGSPTKTYKMEMFIDGFVGMDEEIAGIKNPVLKAVVGDVIKVNLVNGDPLEHDFVIDELGAHTDHVFAEGETVSTTFMANKAGSFYYYCSVPGHRKAGMEGVIEVTAQ